jgi:hypothetical protein
MTSVHHLRRRLDRLGTGRSIETRRVVSIVREEDEPVADAIARWHAAHPDEPPVVDDENTLIIITTIVDPK